MISDQLVLVTGAGGFLAGHVLQRLLQDGYRVRGTIKNLSDADLIKAIQGLAPEAKHKIELVEADLCRDDGWDAATSGCWAVMHIACPVFSVYKKITDEEFNEACLNGTKRVMNAAAKNGVKKFIFTSCIAAIFGTAAPFPKGYANESNWTDIQYPLLDIQEKCATLTEMAVWEFVKEMPEKEKFDLTVLLPSSTLGPPLIKPSVLTGALAQMNMLFDRTYPGVVNLSIAMCDVRDAAYAHCKALTTPKASGERIMIYSESMWLPDYAKLLNEEFKSQGYSFYTNRIPNILLCVPKFFSKELSNSGIFEKIDVPMLIDNSKMKEVFDIKPRPLNETIMDMAYGLIDMGKIYRGKKYRQAGSRVITTPSTS